MGNISSVANAFEFIGADVSVISDPNEIEPAVRIVLPGVGSFQEGMKNLMKFKWIKPLEQKILDEKVPFLGICLGMQLIATIGYENGPYKGLNWVSGVVEKIETVDNSIRIPHIGWNDIRVNQDTKLYNSMDSNFDVYFLHSYHFIPKNRSIISGTCHYGIDFAASIEYENIFATQYHPEKSSKVGLNILKNFLSYG